MTEMPNNAKNKVASRQFKGLSLEERKQIRREKFIDAGLQAYGTHGFFSVTIKDICNEARLTERYFYESFKRSEELFKTVYLQLISELQKNIIQAVMHAAPDDEKMISAGLIVLLKTLQEDPRIARILFIDAVLVQELHGDTIYESLMRFDQTILHLITLTLPEKLQNPSETALIATGLNGYVTKIAMRWVLNDFQQPFEEVLSASSLAYHGILFFLKHQK